MDELPPLMRNFPTAAAIVYQTIAHATDVQLGFLKITAHQRDLFSAHPILVRRTTASEIGLTTRADFNGPKSDKHNASVIRFNERLDIASMESCVTTAAHEMRHAITHWSDKEQLDKLKPISRPEKYIAAALAPLRPAIVNYIAHNEEMECFEFEARFDPRTPDLKSPSASLIEVFRENFNARFTKGYPGDADVFACYKKAQRDLTAAPNPLYPNGFDDWITKGTDTYYGMLLAAAKKIEASPNPV